MRIATWNMAGATCATESKWRNEIPALFNAYNLTLMCLQECGEQPPQSDNLGTVLWQTNVMPAAYGYFRYNLGTDDRPDYFYILIAFTAQRTSPGIIIRGQAPVSFYCVDNSQQFQGARPAIGVQLANGAPVFFTVHAISGGGPNAPSLLTNIAAEMDGPPQQPQHRMWFAAGDYNRQPNEWNNQIPQGVTLLDHVPPITRTASRRNLDYMLHNYGGGVFEPGIVEPGIVASDHYPVIYTL